VKVTKPHPQRCELCQQDIVEKPFVDGKTTFGPWVNMCLACHRDQGYGLGTGRGQRYDKDGVKVDG
jgi:hypothetical protein